MDYKEKVIALLNSQELSKEQKEKLENIFPELKESEDDRITRCLLNYFNHVRYNGLDLKGTDIDEVIAWLEKQGEKVTNINGEDYSIDGLYHAIRILERTIGRVTGYQSDDGILSHEAAIDAVKELYKKQGGQEHFYDFNANDWYVSKVDGKIHDMTYNPTDKVEPKFRVGDWISGYFTNYKVMAINSKGYMVEDTDGNKINILFENEKFHHLFTIKDAKDGDVLVDVYGNIGIFYKCYDFDWMSCCSLGNNGGFQYFTVEHENEKTYPATKEQRDVLFSKMKEAGYEWDSEKKELKKIEVKTLNADKVIAWLVANICDFEHYVKLFKKDFGL